MNDTLITPYVRTPDEVELDAHHPVCDWSDRLAQGITRSLRFLADTFFAKRYGNRAIVLEKQHPAAGQQPCRPHPGPEFRGRPPDLPQ